MDSASRQFHVFLYTEKYMRQNQEGREYQSLGIKHGTDSSKREADHSASLGFRTQVFTGVISIGNGHRGSAIWMGPRVPRVPRTPLATSCCHHVTCSFLRGHAVKIVLLYVVHME